MIIARKSKFMKWIAAEICCDLLIRSPKTANSPRTYSSLAFNNCLPTARLPPKPSPAAFNDCLPIVCQFFSRLRLIFLEESSKEGHNTRIRLGLCGNTQMIPFLMTGTELYRRSLFFLFQLKHFPSFESNSKGLNSLIAILEIFNL